MAEVSVQVLLVRGSSMFTAAVADALRNRGHVVADMPPEAGLLATTPCDLVLVELDCTNGFGVRLCRELRALSDVALIGLATRGCGSHGVAALREGADDYVAHPVTEEELLARIRAVLRRVRRHSYGQLVLGRLCIDIGQRSATLNGNPVPLTRKEFRLLVALARTPGQVVTRDRLMAEVWNTSERLGSRTVDSHITTLRPKIRPAATIANVRGVGYRILTNQ